MGVTTRAVGAPVGRIDGPDKVRGAATYAFEWPVEHPAYLYPPRSGSAPTGATAS